MHIQDFKQTLLDRTLDDSLVIFVCPENTFLAETYIDEICEQKNMLKTYVSSLVETVESSLALVMDYTSELNILKVDTFDELADDYSEFKNCIVLCKKIEKTIKDKVLDYVVEIPKLVDWQVKAYIKALCPGLQTLDIDWLYTVTCGNIFRIKNELDKLAIIDKENQTEALYDLGANLFVKQPVFSLVDALVKNDKATALDFIKHANDYTSTELDPVGLVTLTLQKFRNILLLTYKSGVNQADLGLSSGAIWHIKNDNKNIPLAKLSKAIEFLSNIDTRLKANPSSLDFAGNRKSALLEYIILGTLACSE